MYLEAKTKEGIRINSWVLNIVEDEDGSVWIVVPEQGVFRYVRGKLQLYKVVEGKQMQECPVSHLLVRRNGEVWLSTWGAGLFRYDKSSIVCAPCYGGGWRFLGREEDGDDVRI